MTNPLLEDELESVPTDEELLEWAKENHPRMVEIKRLQERLGEMEEERG